MSRPAKSILTLRDQCDVLAPHRDQSSDGIVGDAAHKALGNKSDHNPWYHDTYTAIDIDNSPEGGLSGDYLWDALISSRDPRIKYIIFKRRIINLTPGHPHFGLVREYTGLNAHKEHLHLSVIPEKCDLTDPWKLWIFRVLTIGMWNSEVALLQHRLNMYGATLKIDGKFGLLTESAVRGFQRFRKSLVVDGRVGPATKRALGI
jgi:hypothetical protein